MPKLKKDFTDIAKKEFEALEKKENELKAQLAEIQKEKKPLRTYLVAAGIIPKGTTGRKPKQSSES